MESIKENFGSIVTIASIVVTLVLWMWKQGRTQGRVETSVNFIKDMMASVHAQIQQIAVGNSPTCADHSARIEHVEGRLDGHDKRITKLEDEHRGRKNSRM